nr:type II toxin-antitoxin system VapC family toxin [Hufsiella ginkgonis]
MLDKHAFLWFINGDQNLSDKARKLIEDPTAAKFVSIVSFWEIAIKINIGKLNIALPFSELKRQLERNGFELLPLAIEHTSRVLSLELHHRDPFDRMIPSQAITEGLAIISRDEHFTNYPVKTFW